MSVKFRKTVLEQLSNQRKWITLLKTVQGLAGILDVFAARIGEIARMEEIAKEITNEEEYFQHTNMLRM